MTSSRNSSPTAPAVAPPADLPARFLSAWKALQPPPAWRRLLVATSGGPDSLALLHLLHETRRHHRLELVVAHADHGIHPDSAAVASRVIAEADALALQAIVGRLHLGAGTSETAARSARHAWLEQTRLTEGADAIVLAHHRGDQVETILMRALAGSGPAGLAGIAPVQGRRVRPLLDFRKSELLAWLESRGIAHWDDPANTDPVHDRSWLRNVVIPLLVERAPDAEKRLLRLGRQAAADRQAWSAVLDVLPALDLRGSATRCSVAALPLATYDSALAVALLQAVARRVGCGLGGTRAARVLALARTGRSGAQLELGGPWRVELAFGRVCFHRVAAVPDPLTLRGERGRAQWGGWQVTWSRGLAPAPAGRDGWVGWFIGGEVGLRGPEPADRLLPLGGTGRRSVARLLQEAQVERGRRSGWPIVVADGEVAWVAGVCRSEAALPREGGEALRIEVCGG